jgi:hypothetical protein
VIDAKVSSIAEPFRGPLDDRSGAIASLSPLFALHTGHCGTPEQALPREAACGDDLIAHAIASRSRHGTQAVTFSCVEVDGSILNPSTWMSRFGTSTEVTVPSTSNGELPS